MYLCASAYLCFVEHLAVRAVSAIQCPFIQLAAYRVPRLLTGTMRAHSYGEALMNARAPGEEPGKEDNGRPGTPSFKISRTGTLGRGPSSAGHAKSEWGLGFGPGTCSLSRTCCVRVAYSRPTYQTCERRVRTLVPLSSPSHDDRRTTIRGRRLYMTR